MIEKFRYNNNDSEKYIEGESTNQNDGNKTKSESNNLRREQDMGKEAEGNKGIYKKVEINSLNPGDTFYLKDDNGNWIGYTHVIKMGKGMEVTYFSKDGGEKMTVPWDTNVYIKESPESNQEKSEKVTLGELKPGDQFILEDGRKGKVIMKYSPDQPQNKDISVLIEGEEEKSFLPWGTQVEIQGS